MTQIAIVPIMLKDILLQIGTDNYETNVSKVLFEPESTIEAWQGLTPASAFTDATVPVWTCTLDYAQDWVTANSLAQYLLANVGQTKVAVFKPQGATTGKPIWTANLIIVPGPFGGEVNKYMVGTVKLGVAGQPVKTANP